MKAAPEPQSETVTERRSKAAPAAQRLEASPTRRSKAATELGEAGPKTGEMGPSVPVPTEVEEGGGEPVALSGGHGGSALSGGQRLLGLG
jgi:hypothetical protein